MSEVNGRQLAKHQPCGCVICTCEDTEKCLGCGAMHCGNHRVGSIPNPVYEAPSLTAELTEAKRRIGELEAGLRRMADPIVALLNETPRGHVFDGEAAARIVDNPHWYRDAARALLSNEKGGR